MTEHIEPYRMKMVEYLPRPTLSQRRAALEQAGYNPWLLETRAVFLDLLSDSGTSAMSDAQWAAMMTGDEAYAGSASFDRLRKAVMSVYDFPYVVPAHQGRSAENVVASLLVRDGDMVPANLWFATTRGHHESRGGTYVDVSIDEAQDPASDHPFKGNLDLDKLRTLVGEVGADRIPFISLAVTCDMAGGQPVSMENIQAVRAFCDAHGLRIFADATRAVENAWFIQQREPGWADKPVADIVRAMASCFDGCSVSGKKDSLVNMGGFVGLRDRNLWEQAKEVLMLYEGMPTYGGLSGRDMAALAQGIYESVDDAYINARIRQVQQFGAELARRGVPIAQPVGGHAVFLDAGRFCAHLSQDEFPAQALGVALHYWAGIRGMEKGTVTAGRDPVTGQHRYPRLELWRLAVPRRVYTDRQLAWAAAQVAALYERRAEIPGLTMVHEPKSMRFYDARFTLNGPLPAPPADPIAIATAAG